MSLLKSKRDSVLLPNGVINPRTRSIGNVNVSADTAMRNSAVWACLRLRADLISTMPLEVYRLVNGQRVDLPTPPVLVNPGGERVGIHEWLYSTQVDLDRVGNSFGIITARDGNGLPARIELQSFNDVVVQIRAGVLNGYRIGGKNYDPQDIWHEKQFTQSGLHVGLSPIAYAAWTVGQYLSAQQFALEWFQNATVPGGILKNSAKTVTAEEADGVKQKFRQSINNRDIFVTGADWDYKFIGVPAAESQFLDALNYGLGDVARFFGVPSDMIDAPNASGTITYANVTQRNLQLLIMNLDPALVRREAAMSNGLLSAPRMVRFNRDKALLRMDPLSRAQQQLTLVNARVLDIDEARAENNKPPITDEQIERFKTLFPPKANPLWENAPLTVDPTNGEVLP